MKIFPDKFRFSFVENDEVTYCKHAPEEWEDNVIKWERSKNNTGILVEYAYTFTFVMEDADYLRACFKKHISLAKVRFNVEIYDNNKFLYVPYYIGDVDFYSYEEDRYAVKVSTINIGFRTAFDANFDTAYEVELQEVNDKVIYEHLSLENLIKINFNVDRFNGSSYQNYVLGTIIDINDSYSNLITVQDVAVGSKDSTNWLIKANQNVVIDVCFLYHVRFYVSDFKGYAELRIYRNDILYVVDHFEPEDASRLTSLRFQGKYENILQLKQGEKIYLVCYLQEGKVSGMNTLDDTYLQIHYTSRDNVNNIILGLHYNELLRKLVTLSSGEVYTKYIDDKVLCTGEVRNVLITSGDIIRGIEGAKIKTSLKNFFSSLAAVFGITYYFKKEGEKEILVIDYISNLFRASMLLGIDHVAEMKRSVLNNYIHNKLTIGYKNQNYENVNGRYEFNTELTFSVNTDAKASELKLVSPYRADAYGIEFLIQEFQKEKTTDSRSDNDVFLFHVNTLPESENRYKLNKNYKVISNSPAGDSIYNVYLSPKNCLMRQISYIASLFYFSGNILKFSSAAKEYDMVSTGNIREHSDIDLSQYAKLFKPVQIEFETRVPENIMEKISTNPNGYILIENENETIKGFILSLSENPGRNRSQTWKLLAME